MDWAKSLMRASPYLSLSEEKGTLSPSISVYSFPILPFLYTSHHYEHDSPTPRKGR